MQGPDESPEAFANRMMSQNSQLVGEMAAIQERMNAMDASSVQMITEINRLRTEAHNQLLQSRAATEAAQAAAQRPGQSSSGVDTRIMGKPEIYFHWSLSPVADFPSQTVTLKRSSCLKKPAETCERLTDSEILKAPHKEITAKS